MLRYFIIILLLLPFSLSAQKKHHVLDKATSESIPYVNIWVENKMDGTTSNEKGTFSLNKATSNDTLVFSAIGYQTKRIAYYDLPDHIFLEQDIKVLEEVSIYGKRKSREFTLGNYNKWKVHSFIGCGGYPYMIARYLPKPDTYQEGLYLKEIKFLTKSAIRNAKFNVRLMATGENGEPKGYIYPHNIIAFAKKGKKSTKIDLEELDIKFPKEGFFIVIEWLIIDANKFDYSYKMVDSKRSIEGTSYEPSFGTIPSKKHNNTWSFSRGEWMKVGKRKSMDGGESKYQLIALELTVEN